MAAAGPVHTYVVDTSVLLADPRALHRFDEHEVVLPLVVITELEAKRHHPSWGYFARAALRCWTSCASCTAGWTSRSPWAAAAAGCASS
jgi:predicted ribonuclease YlaK